MSSPHSTHAMPFLSQDDLDEIVHLHGLYLIGKNGGARAQIKFKNLTGLNMAGVEMPHADFTGSCFIGANLSNGDFTSSTFFAADLRRANLESAKFVRADFRGAFVAGANLNNADLRSADLREGVIMEKALEGYLQTRIRRDKSDEAAVARTVFAGARMIETNLSAIRAVSADFSDADLSNIVIQGADLRDANMEGANLTSSDLTGSDIRGANLTNSIMKNTVMAGVEKRNTIIEDVMTEQPSGIDITTLDKPISEMLDDHVKWLESKGKEGERLDISGFDMRDIEQLRDCTLTAIKAVGTNFVDLDFSKLQIQSGVFDKADFRDCDFSDCDVRGSSFQDARLTRCHFDGANMSPLTFKNKDGSDRILPVNMSGAVLRYSSMRNAKLAGTRFKGADLSFADFTGADLRKADLTEAKINGALFQDADMEGTIMNDGQEMI
jgi:uncharacterized protein YjbI with pentapeptide repeats